MEEYAQAGQAIEALWKMSPYGGLGAFVWFVWKKFVEPRLLKYDEIVNNQYPNISKDLKLIKKKLGIEDSES